MKKSMWNTESTAIGRLLSIPNECILPLTFDLGHLNPKDIGIVHEGDEAEEEHHKEVPGHLCRPQRQSPRHFEFII